MTIDLTKKQIIIGVVILLGIIFLVFFYKPSMKNVDENKSNLVATTTSTTTTASKITTTNSKPVVTTTASSYRIEIYRGFYSPKALNVKKGTTVTWVNRDSIPHRVVADNLGPTSQDLYPGYTYSYKFNTPGVYGYHDYASSSVAGVVIVK